YFTLCTAYIVVFCRFFFFNETATTELYTLSLHDALPICLVVALAYAGGLGVLGFIAYAAAKRRGAPAAADDGVPDWSVTVAAIEQPGVAIAITDRANRLVCANAAYELWFGSSHAPPRLPVDPASAELLARAARAAWREGDSEQITVADDKQSWAAAAQRAGRADDYLIWRFAPIV